MPESPSKDPLVWIDCEMTGLDIENDVILQIACFITDANLNLLEPNGFEIVVHHEKPVLDAMDPWCTRTHEKSGLTAAVLASTVTPEQAAEALLAYVTSLVPTPHKALLAGNTVHADKAYLRQAPYNTLIEHLHHRILDVSAIKEAARRWADPGVLARIPRKKALHEARTDILESIEEARFYRDAFFRRPEGEAESVESA
ncbi:putative RNA exonuclease Rex2 [Trichodelitschia bisporula]|uniref:Putative RNA exonuclease Rex2 n=1 Tax=Trichodelitschia bisporula TaxID=703511 RepID=A0A6G1HRH3_9PEZI|nr:putative RNA exonuclease Rex2 [Trichodelitschia bisporula]